MVELQPSKLNVASSSLVSRSIDIKHRLSLACHTIFLFVAARKAHVAQSVERFLGKEEVHRFDSDRGLHSIEGFRRPEKPDFFRFAKLLPNSKK